VKKLSAKVKAATNIAKAEIPIHSISLPDIIGLEAGLLLLVVVSGNEF
jgi:hypothetical protein